MIRGQTDYGRTWLCMTFHGRLHQGLYPTVFWNEFPSGEKEVSFRKAGDLIVCRTSASTSWFSSEKYRGKQAPGARQ